MCRSLTAATNPTVTLWWTSATRTTPAVSTTAEPPPRTVPPTASDGSGRRPTFPPHRAPLPRSGTRRARSPAPPAVNPPRPTTCPPDRRRPRRPEAPRTSARRAFQGPDPTRSQGWVHGPQVIHSGFHRQERWDLLDIPRDLQAW